MSQTTETQTQKIISPYGGRGRLIKDFHISEINNIYRDKCDFDIIDFFPNVEDGSIKLYECEDTGYKFWHPNNLAGSESFYRSLSQTWPNYYQKTRWEYSYALSHIKPTNKVLEIGSGQGWFLSQVERITSSAVGLELNNSAISKKVCSAPILNERIEAHVMKGKKYDVVASFQVLEHIEDPKSFILAAIELLVPGGLLILSTPNDDFGPHLRFEDAFNFPPHHVGHYNKEVFQKLAEHLNMDVIDIKIQVAPFAFPKFSPSTEKKLIFRVFRKMTSIIGRAVLNYTKEPGHTILCVLRKR